MNPAYISILSPACSRSPSPQDTPHSPSEFPVPRLGILDQEAMQVIIRRLSPRASMEQCMEILKDHDADVLLETADRMKPPNPMFRSIALAAVMQMGTVSPRLKAYLQKNPQTLTDLEQLWINGKPFDGDLIDKASYLWLQDQCRPFQLRPISFGGVDMPAFTADAFLKLGLYLIENGTDQAFLFGEYVLKSFQNKGTPPERAPLDLVVSSRWMKDPKFLSLLEVFGDTTHKAANPNIHFDQTLTFESDETPFSQLRLHVRKKETPPPIDDCALIQSLLEPLPFKSRVLLIWHRTGGWTFEATEGAL